MSYTAVMIGPQDKCMCVKVFLLKWRDGMVGFTVALMRQK